MYSAEDKSTAIAYRLIHQNLPKFIDNISTFEKIKNKIDNEIFIKLYNDFKEELNISTWHIYFFNGW